MIVAKEKRQTNIVEYILYMWQIEDLIRAYQFNMEDIKKGIIPQYNLSGDILQECIDWYDNLAEMMTLEHIKEKGHLQVINNLVNDLDRLHRQLLNDPQEIAYGHIYNATLPFINEFDQKTGKKLSNEIELCLTGIYSKFLLKLQGKEVSKGTEEAIKAFSRFLAFLGGKYHEEQEKERTQSPE
ncbi:DUF4924 family protein [Saccharicrinis fermentans]|uniref:DUF4924 domain-containing protein n=1 Tax=Saccharicrinis fermentans DSM 9555 = JCM 21142 TaxID=869213 RepID=W7YM85_9BACT|nr:DUF4924 family protein [Saccharicrinis fermentans]GAF03509.1 hypothetical protein JCM21142_52186 [Saccharicrinis fermentans DSM 9555 = JCM 21142]